VAELVDALDSKSSFFGSAGSIPALSTEEKPQLLQLRFFIGCNIGTTNEYLLNLFDCLLKLTRRYFFFKKIKVHY
jgi:hypothetical protein